MTDDPSRLTASAMLAGFSAGTLSPVTVVEAALARIARLDAKLNAFVFVAGERALADARHAEMLWRAVTPSGPLCGVPIGVKDIVDVAGMPTSCHSKILAGTVAAMDATVVARLRDAGAIVLGKLATHEFALGGPSFDLPWPPARNPWNLDHHPGGSSSGSAAAVAAGLVPIAVGTDTAGSIRHPAGACGVLGLKPTYEAVPRHGVFPLAYSLDHVGPLARTAADAALAFSVMSGQAIALGTGDEDRPLAGLRVGYVRHFHATDVVAAQEVATALDATADRLRALGARVEGVVLPPLPRFLGVNRIVMFSEAWSIHAAWLRSRPQDYGASGRQRLLTGAFLTAEDYLKAQRLRTGLCAAVEAVLDTVDLLLVANMLDPACRIDDTVELARTTERQARVAFNLTGHPALSIPTGLSASGLPLSGQLVGRHGADRLVLRAWAGLEAMGRPSSELAPID